MALDIPSCYLQVSYFGSVPPDMGTRSVVCGAGQSRKDGGVVILWKQSLPSAGCGGTGPVILHFLFSSDSKPILPDITCEETHKC